MALQIVLADNQIIFRTGVAKVLSLDSSVHLVAQCTDVLNLKAALEDLRDAIVIYPSSLSDDLHEIINWVHEADSRSIVIVEHGAELSASVAERVEGIVLRSVAAPQLFDCIHTVAAGGRSVQQADTKAEMLPDSVGFNLLQRLTPRELQIIALVTEGCKNREIAAHLGTKEQVVKNYLCNIYDKTGVSDRLELALYTIHHRTLAVAAERVRTTMVRAS